MKIPENIDIKCTPYPPVGEIVATMEAVISEITDRSPTDLSPAELAKSSLNQECVQAFIRLADQIWRIGSVVFDSDSGDAKAELSSRDIRKVSNATEAMREVIQSIGIRVIDRCNQDFDPGLPDQVVTEEPREGISRERIIRTIRPTILWHQTMVQRGEIDIAVPVKSKNTEPSNTKP